MSLVCNNCGRDAKGLDFYELYDRRDADSKAARDNDFDICKCNSCGSVAPLHKLANALCACGGCVQKTSRVALEAALDKLPNKCSKTQVGGNHYTRLAVQPWDAMKAWMTKAQFVGYLRGNVVKYIARDKNGIEDLKKARHYLDKLIEELEDASGSS